MKNILKIFTVLFLTLNIMPSIANDEKQQAYESAKTTEQSKANRLLTSASTAATGIGTMELAQGLAEQKADKAAEQAMSAYVSTMRCSYGNGKSVKAGMDEIELPGGNNANMMKYRTEYTALAADLKERKNALDMTPGIESEEILDKSQMGLYDDENVGINGGRYASLYRAQMLGSESDQAQLDSAKQTSKNRVIGGAVAAGVGVVGGIVGDELINQSLSSSTKTAQTCTESGGTWQGARCHCPDGFIQRTKTGPCFEEQPTETAENPTSSQGNYPPSQSGTHTQPTGEYEDSPTDNSNTDKETGTQTTDPTAMNVKNEETDNPTQVVSTVPQADDPKDNSVEKAGNDNKDGNDDSNVISQAPTVTGQELVTAKPVDNNFVWNGTNSNDSSADLSTLQAKKDNSAAAVGTDANKTEPNSYKKDIQQSNLYEKNCEKNGGKINEQGTCICPDGSAANITGDCLNPNTFDNDTSNLDALNNDKTISSQTKLTCGVVGKKECNSNYYVCESDSDCTSDKLPANATAGHCWKSGSRSVCTATACKDTHEVSQGHCVKKKVVERNDSAKSSTSTAQRPNTTEATKTNTEQKKTLVELIGRNNLNADPTNWRAKMNNGKTVFCEVKGDFMTAKMEKCSGLGEWWWDAKFSYGTIQGKSKCAKNNNTGSQTCYCYVSRYTNNNGKTYVFTQSQQERVNSYTGAGSAGYECAASCPKYCAQTAMSDYSKRQNIFNKSGVHQ